MKALLLFLLSVVLALTPFASVPAHARARRIAPTSFFCPMGALASSSAPTTNLPMNDGCFTASQPQTDGSTGGFKLVNCWAGGGLGAANVWNGVSTDYSASNASPLTVSTPFNSPGCEYPIGLQTPLASHLDPVPAGTSVIPNCTYNATGSWLGHPELDCSPNVANAVNGVWTLRGWNFGQTAAHGCLPVYIHNVTGAINQIALIDNNFTNDTGACATFQFNPVMLNIDSWNSISGKSLLFQNNVFDGNGFVWRTNQGSCPTKNTSCNAAEALQFTGGSAVFQNNLFTNWIGRTIATRTDTNQNLFILGNFFLGGDVAGPEHGEFTQTFTDGTPNGDSIHAYNNFWKHTGSTASWDALDLTTYTGASSGGAWTHNVVDHNIYINGFSGASTRGGGLTGCTIASGTSTLVCTGVSGGKVGAGQQSGVGVNGCGTDQISFQLGYLVSSTGVQGSDWDNAGPGGGQWVSSSGVSSGAITTTWALDGNPPGNIFTFVGGIDNGSGGAGTTLTVTTAGGYSIDPTALQTVRDGFAKQVFTETSTNNFNNGDTVQVGNNTFTYTSAVPTVAGQVFVDYSFTGSAANLALAINGGAQPSAQAVFTGTGPNFGNGDTMVVGNNTYHFVTPLGATPGNILIGASNSASLTNLGTAINTPGSCTTTCIAAANTPNITSTHVSGLGTLTAITPGAGGNSLVSTYTPIGTSAGSFTTGSTFIGGVAYVAPGTTPNITASSNTTSITFTNKVIGGVGNTNPSVYTTSGTAAGTFPSATFHDGVTSFQVTALGTGTGGVGTYTINTSQFVPPGATMTSSMFPYYAGQWSVTQNETRPSPLTFSNAVSPAVISFMGYDIFNGSAMTNNLVDSSVNTTSWAPWSQQVTNSTPPACIANDLLGADPSNPTFTIFGTQNFDMAKNLTNINRWNQSSFVANLCGP